MYGLASASAEARSGGQITVAKDIIAKEGFGGMYRGLSAGLLRQATYTTARLGIFNNISTYLKEANHGKVTHLRTYLNPNLRRGSASSWCGSASSLRPGPCMQGARRGRAGAAGLELPACAVAAPVRELRAPSSPGLATAKHPWSRAQPLSLKHRAAAEEGVMHVYWPLGGKAGC